MVLFIAAGFIEVTGKIEFYGGFPFQNSISLKEKRDYGRIN